MKTLAILAAGLGTRFGTGIKQLEPIDDYGHIIIDYSIHDAIAAGFRMIVFIIRHDIEKDFREVIGDRIEAVCKGLGVEVAYAFQETEDVPEWSGKAEGRTKPWGRACCAGLQRDCKGTVLSGPMWMMNSPAWQSKLSGMLVALYTLGIEPIDCVRKIGVESCTVLI